MVPNMTPLEAHHDLALMLLVGRSLPTGIPWSMEEDQILVARERILWAQLTEPEREVAQAALLALWGRRGASRAVAVYHHWGPWAQALGPTFPVTDAAFGIPEAAFRPQMKGVQVLIQEHPELTTILQWLWDRGFHPVELNGVTLTLLIPAHRIVQESERLVGMLTRDWTAVPVSPPVQDANLTVQGTYDPVTGRATLLLTGVVSESFPAKKESM